MAIVIPLDAALDIETYDGLKDWLVMYLELDSETESQLPSLIRMAEYRLNRMLTVPERETLATVNTTAGVQSVDLPQGFRQLRTAYLDSEYPLAPVTLNVLHSQFSDCSGRPQVYTVQNQALAFGPVPDAEYAVTLTYMAKLDYLSAANQTNWLLRDNADAYVYACLVQCEAFLGNDARIPLFESALVTAMDEINQAGNRYRNAGPICLRSSVVV